MTEESKYLDKLFQSKFAGFEVEPPATVWTNVHKEIHGKGGGSINPVNLAVLAALVLISGLLGFSIIKDSPATINNSLNQEENKYLLAEHREDPLKQETSPALLPEQQSAASAAPHANILPSKDIDPVIAEEESKSNAVTSHSGLHDRFVETSYSPEFQEETRLAKLKARRSFSVHASMQNMNNETILVRDNKLHPKYSTDGESKYNRRATWQLGVFFTPEVLFYPEDSIPNQTNYNVDVSAKWIKNEFFIESGLGVSFSSDDGKYAIDYERFLGSYDDVYNVTFDTTETGAIVPNYHTNIVDVYDSISKFKVEKTSNKYTYLHIPLYVGFHKQHNRFGWFVKAGPIFSVMLAKNIPDPNIGQDKIITLDQRMPSRVNTYWQLGISAGIHYQLSNKVSIAIEPSFKYYLNSQYERKYISTPHPYSIGLRTGLLFNF